MLLDLERANVLCLCTLTQTAYAQALPLTLLTARPVEPSPQHDDVERRGRHVSNRDNLRHTDHDRLGIEWRCQQSRRDLVAGLWPIREQYGSPGRPQTKRVD